jgi:hypothetical protein
LGVLTIRRSPPKPQVVPAGGAAPTVAPRGSKGAWKAMCLYGTEEKSSTDLVQCGTGRQGPWQGVAEGVVQDRSPPRFSFSDVLKVASCGLFKFPACAELIVIAKGLRGLL